MATSTDKADKPSIRSLTLEERDIVISGLDFLQKSALRAQKAATNSVIAMEHGKIAAQASNLIMHFKNHSFDI